MQMQINANNEDGRKYVFFYLKVKSLGTII